MIVKKRKKKKRRKKKKKKWKEKRDKMMRVKMMMRIPFQISSILMTVHLNLILKTYLSKMIQTSCCSNRTNLITQKLHLLMYLWKSKNIGKRKKR